MTVTLMQELITNQLVELPSAIPTLLFVMAMIVLILGIIMFLLRKIISVILSLLLAFNLMFLGVKLIKLTNSDYIITKNYNIEYTGNSLKLTQKNTTFFLKDNVEFKVTHENNQVKIENDEFSKSINESEFLKYIGQH